MKPKRWRIRPHDAGRVQELQQAARVPAVVAQLLLARGITSADQARMFLQAPLSALHPPNTLAGAEAAARVLWQAIQRGETIVVYGDYDADGLCGCAILYRCLKRLGGQVRYYVPCRLSEGYGLHADALRELRAAGAQVVVTVDCGITSVSEAQLAGQLGLKLLITDHHRPGPQLPRADVVVHPALPGHSAPYEHLSGAAVAFKVAWALCRLASGTGTRVTPALGRFLRQMLGYAALGTVADVVPLLGENRILVRHGLEALQAFPTAGVAALLRLARMEGRRLSSEDVAFALAPRLNAAGRLGQALLAIELLVTENPQRAQALAQHVDQLNQVRRSKEQSIYLAALKQIDHLDQGADAPAFVLSGHKWHPGVIGIVAGRLAEKFHRPVVLLSLHWGEDALAVGSARSAAGVDLYQALAACRQHLERFGGHAAAAGLKIHPQQIDHFRRQFCQYVAQALGDQDPQPELLIDAEVPLGTLTLEAVKQIELLAPFGHANPRPVICATGVEVAGPVRTMGGAGRHLSFMLRQGPVQLRAVAFGQAGEWAQRLSQNPGPLAVAFQPVINTFNGYRSVELHLSDWMPLAQLAKAVGAE